MSNRLLTTSHRVLLAVGLLAGSVTVAFIPSAVKATDAGPCANVPELCGLFKGTQGCTGTCDLKSSYICCEFN